MRVFGKEGAGQQEHVWPSKPSPLQKEEDEDEEEEGESEEVEEEEEVVFIARVF